MKVNLPWPFFVYFPREVNLDGVGFKIDIADIKLEDLADPCRQKKAPFIIKMETDRSLTQQSPGDVRSASNSLAKVLHSGYAQRVLISGNSLAYLRIHPVIGCLSKVEIQSRPLVY